jgi:hypothetical protein
MYGSKRGGKLLQVVYVLINPAMPGFVKIGKTLLEDVGLRLSQLYTTGVPFPFELAFACKVPNADEVEKALHRAFAPYRANPKREFFNIDPEQAIAIFKLLHVQDATAEIARQPTDIPIEEIDAGKQFKARRPNLNFKEMGIPVGAVLNFTEGEATVTVSGERKVMLNGEETSLTAATRQLLGLDYSVAPGPYWTYDGKLLREIYNETYGQVD